MSRACGPRLPAGSRGHEREDAQSFADWEVDFLKYDNCWAPPADWVVDRYTAMRDALNSTRRPILFSMCDWGVGDPWLWAPKVRLLPWPVCCFVDTHGFKSVHILGMSDLAYSVHLDSLADHLQVGVCGIVTHRALLCHIRKPMST